MDAEQGDVTDGTHDRQDDGHRKGHLAGTRDIESLVSGGELGRRKRAEAAEAGPARTAAAELQQSVELHVCMGLNACTGHGRDGSGLMAGTGECATVFHVCHGANECRGQGGCGYSGSAAEQSSPGDQSCRWNGSCASPVNESRVHAAGPYRGTSVWKRARKIFEHRMYEAGVPFGTAPGEGYPDDLVPSYETQRGPKESGS